MNNREEIISQMTGETESPVEGVESSEEKVEAPLTIDSSTEVVKEPESQTEEPSTSPEETVESDEAVNPPIDLSDEDINKTYEEKKTNIQKRLDRLTAEKKSAQEEAWEYKQELEKLKQEVETLKKPESKEKTYSDEQLKAALVKAREDGDVDLEFEIMQELKKNEVKKLEDVQNKKKIEEEAFRTKENEVWAQYVETFPYSDDPQLDLNDKNSLLLRYTSKLYQDNPKHYNKFGYYRLVQAVNDARDLILQSRISKINNKQTETLEKKLAREKLKNGLGGGVSGVDSGTTETAPRGNPVDDMLSERMEINRKSRLFQTS